MPVYTEIHRGRSGEDGAVAVRGRDVASLFLIIRLLLCYGRSSIRKHGVDGAGVEARVAFDARRSRRLTAKAKGVASPFDVELAHGIIHPGRHWVCSGERSEQKRPRDRNERITYLSRQSSPEKGRQTWDGTWPSAAELG